MLSLCAEGRLVRCAETAGRTLLGKTSILLLLCLGSVAGGGAIVVAVCVALRVRSVV